MIFSKLYIALIIFCALFAEWLCNERPLIMVQNNTLRVTAYAFNNHIAGRPTLKAPIRFSPETQDIAVVHSLSPVQSAPKGHYLGTDELGRDILANLIYGCRTACVVSLIAVAVACILGVFVGILTGYAGNDEWKIKNTHLWSLLFSAMPVWFYGWNIRYWYISRAFKISLFSGLKEWLISLIIGGLIYFVIHFWIDFAFQKLKAVKKVSFPVDSVLSRATDIFLSLPLFYVALLVFTLIKSVNLIHVALLIGLTSWVSYARLTRAEVMRLRHQPFIEAAETEGAQVGRIWLKHILPNALSPIVVNIMFGMANAILAESAFSVIGLLPTDHVSWGTLLSDARHTPEAWWLSVFPGGMLTLLMLSLYALANGYKKSAAVHQQVW